MRHRTLLAPSLLLIALAGCAAHRDEAAVVAPPPPAEAPIEALSEHDGAVLVELGIGGLHAIAVGDFLRAYGEDADRRRLKGTLQVSELIGDDRCVARLIALNDRSDPLRTGDRVKVVADLGAEDPLDAPPAVAAAHVAKATKPAKPAKPAKVFAPVAKVAVKPRAAKADPLRAADALPIAAPAAETPAPAAHDAGDPDDGDARFATVREHYQRELVAMQARHDAEAAELRRQLAAQAEEAAAHEQHALADRELAQRTELAAFKAESAERYRAQLAAENAARDQRLDHVAAERDGLKAQVETLLREQERLKQDAAQAKAAASESDERRRRELRAEVETREVLQARLTEIEKKLDGKPGGVAPILVNDPDRHETVLERLDRVERELSDAQARVAATGEELAAAKTRQQELEQRAVAADARAKDADAQRAELEATRARVTALTGEAESQRLARLEAERALYDLAARVLRLKADAETAGLQDRVRTTLAALEPAPDAAGSPTEPDARQERTP